MDDVNMNALLNAALADAVVEWRSVLSDDYVGKITQSGEAWGGNDKRLLKAALDEKFIRTFKLGDEMDACVPDGNQIADMIREEVKDTRLMSDRVIQLRPGWMLIRTPMYSTIKATFKKRVKRENEWKLLIDFYEQHLEEGM